MFRAWSRIHPKRLNKETHYGLGLSSLFGFKLAVVAVCLHFVLFNYAIDSFKSTVFFCCSLLLRTEFVFWHFLSLSDAFSSLWPTSLNKRAIFLARKSRSLYQGTEPPNAQIACLGHLPSSSMHYACVHRMCIKTRVWNSSISAEIHRVCFFYICLLLETNIELYNKLLYSLKLCIFLMCGGGDVRCRVDCQGQSLVVDLGPWFHKDRPAFPF